MKRYHCDYGVEFHSARNRRPLTRAEAARVVAAPLPKRASERRWPIVRHRSGERHMPGGLVHALCWATVLIAWATAWIVAFNWY